MSHKSDKAIAVFEEFIFVNGGGLDDRDAMVALLRMKHIPIARKDVPKVGHWYRAAQLRVAEVNLIPSGEAYGASRPKAGSTNAKRSRRTRTRDTSTRVHNDVIMRTAEAAAGDPLAAATKGLLELADQAYQKAKEIVETSTP